MDMKPVNIGLTRETPIRSVERLQVNEDGSVQAHAADKVELQKKGPVEKALTATTKFVLTGFGTGAGLVGGGMIGAAAAGGMSAATQLMANGISWGAVGSVASIGGIAGAALFGVAGAFGGWTFSEKLIQGAKYIKNLLFTKQPLTAEQQNALNTLKGVEDNPKDARRVLNYLVKNLAANENLESETGIYTGLAQHFQKNTQNALSAYASFRKMLPPGEEREQALAELAKFAPSSKTPEDAMDALYMVVDNLNAGETIPRECDDLRAAGETLKKCAGDEEITPAMAGRTYALFKKNFPASERAGAMSDTLGKMAGAKAGPQEILANLDTLIEARQKGDDLGKEAANLMGIVEKAGGNMETARLAYATTKDVFAPGTRGEGLKNFFALNEMEKTPKQAAETLVQLQKGLYEGENLSDQIAFYASVQKLCNSSHESSLDAYKTITANFKKGEEREGALEQFTKLTAAEKAAGQDTGKAADDFKFVYTHMSEGEKFPEQMDKFIGLLSSGGSSSKAQTAYLEAKFKELYKA